MPLANFTEQRRDCTPYGAPLKVCGATGMPAQCSNPKCNQGRSCPERATAPAISDTLWFAAVVLAGLGLWTLVAVGFAQVFRAAP